MPAEGTQQWLKWSLWKAELGSMPLHGWLCHCEDASAWQAASQCKCSAPSGWPLATSHLLRFFLCASIEAMRHRQKVREGWIHSEEQVLNKWMWQGERVEGWEAIGRLCIRFPHVWHIKKLRTHTYTPTLTDTHTALWVWRTVGCWTALAWQRLPTHLPSVLVMQLLVNMHVCAWSMLTCTNKQTNTGILMRFLPIHTQTE